MSFAVVKERILKLLLLGDTSVGKTSMAIRYTEGKFPDPDKLKSTIGVAFFSKKVKLNNETIVAQIWDFAGQDHFRSFMRDMFKGAAGGLFVFDVTQNTTLDDLKNFWIPEIEKYLNIDLSSGNHPFILVGNKVDLLSDTNSFTTANAVKMHELDAIIEKYKFEYIATSAKTGKNVDLAFQRALEKAYEFFVKRKEKKVNVL